MTTLNSGVNDDNSGILFEDDATSLLLAQWTDAERPSDAVTKEGPNADADTGDDEEATLIALAADEENDENADTDSQSDNPEDNEDNTETPAEAGDDAIVSITVDGEVQKVKVSALKRLHGQEASLTRKSQEVAAARKAVELEAERYMVSSQKLLTKAEERFAPFAKIDWMVAQQRLKPDEFAAIREEARAAHTELQFLKAEANEVLGQLHTERQEQLVETAKETVATLTRDVPGWNREVYDRVRTHAVETGMDPQVVNSVVDPAAIKLMHDAMRYRELKAKAATKRTSTPAAAKRVVKQSSTTTGSMGTKTKAEDARTRLSQTGKEQDAMAALLAGWESTD